MKLNIKKTLTIILALAMMLALAVPAFAAEKDAKKAGRPNVDPATTTIYFDTDGGVLDDDENPQTVRNNHKYNTDQLPAATKDGYIFDGWYYNGKPLSGKSFSFTTEEVTVVAHWVTIESQKDSISYQLKKMGFSAADINKIFDMFANRNQNVGSVLASEPVWGVIIAALIIGAFAGGTAFGRTKSKETKEQNPNKD